MKLKHYQKVKMGKNIEQKFAPDLAVLLNSASFICWKDSSHLNGQTGEIGVIPLKTFMLTNG